jgi:CHAD domain-containing protein
VEESWNALSASIKDCRQKPTKDAVHHVRTRCRRMEALISSLISTHSGNGDLEAAGTAVLRKLKKIRREAGAVRDLDIHLLLLDSLLEKTAAQQQDKAAKKLKKALKKERERLAVSTLQTIETRKGKLETKAAGFIKIFDSLPAREQQLDTLALATARFLETSAAMPVLREENLHEFRKRSKAARYVAELNPHSPASARLAKQLNRVQDAIGAWHDWDVMEQETAGILDGKGKVLQGQMDVMRRKTYRVALAVARKTQRELLHHAS